MPCNSRVVFPVPLTLLLLLLLLLLAAAPIRRALPAAGIVSRKSASEVSEGDDGSRAAAAAKVANFFALTAGPAVIDAEGKLRTFSACICAKCGSTSFFSAIYRGLYGRAFQYRGGSPNAPFVHEFLAWAREDVLLSASSTNGGLSRRQWSAGGATLAAGVENALLGGVRRRRRPRPPPPRQLVSTLAIAPTAAADRIHFWVTRDPIDRYVSAWNYVAKCCGAELCWDATQPGVKGNASAWAVVPELLELTGYTDHGDGPDATCLSFTHFVGLLRRAHDLGLQAQLNEHVIPQHLACPSPDPADAALSFRGSLDAALDAWNAMTGVADLDMPKFVASQLNARRRSADDGWVPLADDVRSLCELSMDEYAAMGRPLPNFCTDGIVVVDAEGLFVGAGRNGRKRDGGVNAAVGRSLTCSL